MTRDDRRLRRNIHLLAILAATASTCGIAAAQTSPAPYTYGVRYDAMGRVVGTIDPDPDGGGPLHYRATRNTYDGSGLLTKVETGELLNWQSEAIAPASWTNFTVSATTVTDYDAADRPIRKAIIGSDGIPATISQFSYDALGRQECVAVRMNSATFSALPTSACTLATAGSLGPDRISKNVYDAAGQTIQVRKAMGTSLEQAFSTYTYDPDGKPLSVTDANGNKATMTYDGFDRETRWNFPSPTVTGQTSTTDYEEYGYDANNNRTSARKRDGRTFAFAYDALNRMTVKVVPDACVSGYACTAVPASATRDVYFNYDLQGLQTAARFDSATGSDAVLNGYDGFGRQISTTTSLGGASRTITFQYDADGNRTRVTHPDGNYFAYDYDGLDRAIAIRENGAGTVVTMSWDAAGGRSGETRGAVSSSYGYDPASRLASLADDLSGTAQDVTTTFAYNPASQIINQNRSNTAYRVMSYVPVNRTYTVNGLNQYSAVGGNGYGYDSNGNLAFDGATSFTYDAENRLVTTSTGANLVYDPLGRLFQTSTGGTGVTQFLYDGDQLTAEYGGSGSLVRRYVHGTGHDDPLLWYEGAGLADRRSLQIDRQGSIVSIADAGGTATSIYSYDEYGIPGAGQTERFQYTGQAWIPELGMYYYKARIYSPTLGRFLQVDPVGYKDQLNLYAYVSNDPMDLTDFSGETPEQAGKWAERVAQNRVAHPDKTDGYEPYSFNSEVRGLWAGTIRGGYGAPKCNIFVYDALRAGGVAPGLVGGAPPRAKAWGNPNTQIGNYRVLKAGEKLQYGDVISNGEHVGIYTPHTDKKGGTTDLTTSAASANLDRPDVPQSGGPVTNNWGFRQGKGKGIVDDGMTVRRFTPSPMQ